MFRSACDVCHGDAVVEVRRFHVESGPDPLFERVHQTFAAPRQLKTHGRHLADRLAQHSGPLSELDSFDPKAWELVMVEARTDTGRFVSTTWRRHIEGREWGLSSDSMTLFVRSTRRSPASAARARPSRAADRHGNTWRLLTQNWCPLIGTLVEFLTERLRPGASRTNRGGMTHPPRLETRAGARTRVQDAERLQCWLCPTGPQ
jgi:hypothetical protein